MKPNKDIKKNSQIFKARILWDEKNSRKRLKISSFKWFQYNLDLFSVGEDITLYLSSKKPVRSLEQNNFYWHYLKLIEDETGNSSQDLHSLFKGQFLAKGITEIFGHKVRKVRSSTKLNKSEFAEYLLQIETLSGVPLPSTEEYNPKFYGRE